MKKKNKQLIRQLFDYKGFPFVASVFLALFVLEKKYALRQRKASLPERLKTNALLTSTATLGLRLSLIPAMVKATSFGERKGWGLVRNLPLSPLASAVLGFLLLDYGSYRWHRLNHQIPLLWRFHQVHHADLDLDVSTALRFHVGEVLISDLYRGAWALLAGVSPRLVLLYEIIFEAATNFHHSNLKISGQADRGLANFIVTPRMHGIHHSVIKRETDSNYSVIFTLWDRLHHTLRLDIPQEEILIGVPYVRAHKGTKDLLRMPLQKVKEWRFPDGTIPERKGS